MRAIRSRYPNSASLRRTASRSTPSYLQSPGSRSAQEHAAIAAAASKWEAEVIAGLRSFVGKVIPLSSGESLRITHVVAVAVDETLAGWYNWRGVTNPDAVLLGTLVGGAHTGAIAAVAVDAKLSARSGKLQVLSSTLAQLLEPFQPLTNLVDSILGAGASARLALRDGFHVVRGVATTIDTAAKSTRALRDPEFAAAWEAAQPVKPAPVAASVAPTRPTPRPRAEAPPRAAANRTRTPRRPATAPAPVAVAVAPTSHPTDDVNGALLREAVWALDALAGVGAEMPEPHGVYTLTDVLALDGYRDAPAAFVLLGRHGAEPVAQAVVLGTAAPLPTEATVAATLAALPGSTRRSRYRVVPSFRIVSGRADTLRVLGVRRTLVLTA